MARQAPGIVDYVIMTINYLSLCDLGYITNGALPTHFYFQLSEPNSFALKVKSRLREIKLENQRIHVSKIVSTILPD